LERAAAQAWAAPAIASDADEYKIGITMTNDKEDPLLDSARRERAKRWAHTDLHGYPTAVLAGGKGWAGHA
jgi:hypothetical protein